MSNTDSSKGKVLLVISSAIFMLLGITYLIAPQSLVAPFGIAMDGAKGLTEIRAVFGGFQCGAGLFLCWSCLDNSRVSAGLMALFCITAAMASCRGIGALVAGELGFHLVAMIIEGVWATLAYYNLHKRSTKTTS